MPALCHTMLRDVRVAAGLGSPPSIFTTDASESINAVLKTKMNLREYEWPEFNEAMKKFVMAQRDDIICLLMVVISIVLHKNMLVYSSHVRSGSK